MSEDHIAFILKEVVKVRTLSIRMNAFMNTVCRLQFNTPLHPHINVLKFVNVYVTKIIFVVTGKLIL